jgi:hypothetical protein
LIDTYGPQGNPYEGGPQCDGNWNGGGGNGGGANGNGNGNSNGNGNGQVAVLNGESSRLQISFALGAVLLVLAALL